MNNYFPISIISSIAIFKLIFIIQYYHSILIHSISPFQPAFRPNFSITTALLKFTNDVSSCYEKGQATGAIFIVISEAFDMVDHCLFVYKLYYVGLTKNALLSFKLMFIIDVSVLFSGLSVWLFNCWKGCSTRFYPGSYIIFSIFITDLPLICSNCSVNLVLWHY